MEKLAKVLAVGGGNFSVHRTYLSGHDILILKKVAELKSAAFLLRIPVYAGRIRANDGFPTHGADDRRYVLIFHKKECRKESYMLIKAARRFSSAMIMSARESAYIRSRRLIE
ncbi:hypothetical protein QNN00_10735 [Bacillus velezensis]|nr:hypothetical protein [Bacillus velezensis]